MELENEVFGQVGLISPNDPPNPSIDEAELVARGIN